MKNKITSFKGSADKGEERFNSLDRRPSGKSGNMGQFSPKGSQVGFDKGIITDPNLEMSCYLKEKITVLEKENSLLKNELSMKMSMNIL